MKVLAVRTLDGLRPQYASDWDGLKGIKVGDMVTVEVKKPRNPKHHALYFAALNLIHQNQSRFPTVQALHEAVKVHLGYCKTLALRDGREVAIPGSIAWHAMDQTQFSEFWARFEHLIRTELLPGVKSEDLRRELLEMTQERVA